MTPPALIALSLTALIFGAAEAVALDYRAVKRQGEFTEAVVNKTITADWGWIRLSPGGQITGEVNGAPVRGAWSWENGYYCREYAYGDTTLAHNCQTIHISGRNLLLIRDKGKGRRTLMHIE